MAAITFITVTAGSIAAVTIVAALFNLSRKLFENGSGTSRFHSSFQSPPLIERKHQRVPPAISVKRELREPSNDALPSFSRTLERQNPFVSDVIHDLQRSAARWEQIFSTLNPWADETLHDLLCSIRGPHMFAPHVALNVIEAAIPESLPRCSRLAVLTVLRCALNSSDRVVLAFE